MRSAAWKQLMGRAAVGRWGVRLFWVVMVAAFVCGVYNGLVKTISAQEGSAEPMAMSEGGGGPPISCILTTTYACLVYPSPNYGTLSWTSDTICVGGFVNVPGPSNYDFGTAVVVSTTREVCSDGSTPYVSVGTNTVGFLFIGDGNRFYWNNDPSGQVNPGNAHTNGHGVYAYTADWGLGGWGPFGTCGTISNQPIGGTFTVTVTCPGELSITADYCWSGTDSDGDTWFGVVFTYCFGCDHLWLFENVTGCSGCGSTGASASEKPWETFDGTFDADKVGLSGSPDEYPSECTSGCSQDILLGPTLPKVGDCHIQHTGGTSLCPSNYTVTVSGPSGSASMTCSR